MSKSTFNRRAFLKETGVATIGSVTLPPQIASADDEPQSHRLALDWAADLKPFQQVSPPALAPLEVIVFSRMAFGPRPGDLEIFRSLGNTDEERLTAYVDQQLNPDFDDDATLKSRFEALNFQTFTKSVAQLWTDHVRNSGENGGWPYRILPFTETRRATFLRAVYSQWQLNEVLADFWHNHFNVMAHDSIIGPMFVQYDRDVIRPNIFGNFRVMLEAVAKSTAMLYYLDNYINSREGPNENYARELFELHMLGAENYLGSGIPQDDVPGHPDNPIGYVDGDVYEATRCFTGWCVRNSANDAEIRDSGEYFYYSSWHDRFKKDVLGQTMPPDQADEKDGLDVLDLVAQHPRTGRYIARKLCTRLVSDQPTEDLIAQVAQVFSDNWQAADQLKTVIRTILLSDAFRTTWGEKIKRPFEVAVSACRVTNANVHDFEDSDWQQSLRPQYDAVGQPLFQWPPPTGYPDDRETWSSTVPMIQRWRLCTWMVDTWRDGDGNYRLDTLGQLPSETRAASKIVDFWIERIFGRNLASDIRTQFIEFMAEGHHPDFDLDLADEIVQDRLRSLAILMLNSPDFQWR